MESSRLALRFIIGLGGVDEERKPEIEDDEMGGEDSVPFHQVTTLSLRGLEGGELERRLAAGACWNRSSLII